VVGQFPAEGYPVSSRDAVPDGGAVKLPEEMRT